MTERDRRRGKKREERNLDLVNTKTRKKRRQEATKEWRLQPIEEYLNMKNREIQDEYLRAIERNIRRFEDFLITDLGAKTDTEILGVRDAIEGDIRAFRDEVLKPDQSLRNSTIATKLGHLSQFYNALDSNYAIAGNPAAKPVAEFRANHDIEPDRPYVPIHRMKTFLNWLTYPFSRAFWLAGFKHGSRFSEVANIDLRCLHIDHPIFWKIIETHDVVLDPRIRDKPDTVLIYGSFNKGEEIPNEDTPGPETNGEIRNKVKGNKRQETNGSVLPLDSEFKTALLEYLLVRPPTYGRTVHPLFALGGVREVARRPVGETIRRRLWEEDSYRDSIQRFSAEEALEDCPTCGEQLIEENVANGDKTGRRFRCRRCSKKFWRSIHWAPDEDLPGDESLDTEQKMTYHQSRHYFTNGHDPLMTDLHDGAIPDKIRKKRIRGDSNQQGDTEDKVYKDSGYEDYDADVREPYLNGIYKFDLYDDPIPAVGEGRDA
jgi:hypothetical protein